MIKSVHLVCFAKDSRLLSDVHGLNLLLQEQDEELLTWVSACKNISEILFIDVASHESWRKSIHKRLRELSVSDFDNLFKDIVVILEIGRDKFELLTALPETLHLEIQLFEGFFAR